MARYWTRPTPMGLLGGTSRTTRTATSTTTLPTTSSALGAEELFQLLLSFRWLHARLLAADVSSLIADYRIALDSGHGEAYSPALRLVRDAIELSSRVLAVAKGQLWHQLYSRLMVQTDARVKAMLAEPPPGVWMRPLKLCLIPPDTVLRNRLLSGKGGVMAVAVARQPCWAVSGTLDGTLTLWDLDHNTILGTMKGHQDGVTSVAVSNNAKWAISGSYDHTVRVWDLRAMREASMLSEHRGSVMAVGLSDNGQTAVTGDQFGVLLVWDWDGRTGMLRHTLRGHGGSVLAVAVSADGRKALSGSFDRTVWEWDLAGGKQMRKLEGHRDAVLSLALSRDSRVAASGSADLNVRVWDLELQHAALDRSFRAVQQLGASFGDQRRPEDDHLRRLLRCPGGALAGGRPGAAHAVRS